MHKFITISLTSQGQGVNGKDRVAKQKNNKI